jgi:hypothetical protein
MVHLRRSIISAALVALGTGCAGQAAAPTLPVPNSAIATALPHKHPLWGIALNGLVSVTIPKGLSDEVIKQTFCQVPKSICPLETDGLRSHGVTATKSATWDSSSYSVTTTASSTLGAFAFHHTLSTTSSSGHINQAVVALTNFDWFDYMTLTSKVSPYGTHVSYKVTTSVVPTKTEAPCNTNDTESVQFDLDSTGLPGKGYETVYGKCVGAKFKYYTQTPAHVATSAVSTISGTVGQTLNLHGDGSITSSLCQVLGCIPQSVNLEGAVKYTIVPVTKGAGFTTASGVSYK